VRRRVLLDTGPLVAFLDRADRYHDWVKTQWEGIRPPFLTCESVLSEACFLLGSAGLDSSRVLDLVARGVVVPSFRVETEATTIGELMRKYSEVPMSLADACLVRMAEGIADSTVMTVDKDFLIYRMHGRKVVPSIMPGTA
jgi:predicted nucleic acid-binding protein